MKELLCQKQLKPQNRPGTPPTPLTRKARNSDFLEKKVIFEIEFTYEDYIYKLMFGCFLEIPSMLISEIKVIFPVGPCDTHFL